MGYFRLNGASGMIKLIVTKNFEITTTPTETIFANVGDVLIVKIRDSEHYNILKLNGKNIFSRWMRQAWVNSKTNKIK